MSDVSPNPEPAAAAVESPPPSPRPPLDDVEDPRMALNRLAAALAQSRSPRFLIEYLRLRRALRA